MSTRTALRIAALSIAAAALLVLIREVSGNSPERVERYGMVIGIKPEKIEYYKKLHAAAWPGVLAKIRECHIRKYSIYFREVEKGQYLLFSYFEYTGGDFEADMARMAADPTTREWWKETDPCQSPIPTRGEKEFWSRMEEVFHLD
ncbi:MAG: L-rhamnose mutarotase [Acidobacteria bacterium]|nr:L-rhamnose mutarotase [Acidobacteriota bacterium]